MLQKVWLVSDFRGVHNNTLAECPILVRWRLFEYIMQLMSSYRSTSGLNIFLTLILSRTALELSSILFQSDTMKLFGADVFCTVLLLITSTNAFSFDLSKRALKFDDSCNTKYGKLTAKQLIDKSIDFQPKLAKAGKDSLDTLIAALEYQSKVPGAKKPSASKKELDKIIATYRVVFGDLQAKNDDGTPNPNFKKEAADHIAAMKVTRDSLNRMTKPGNPDLIIHCNDDWLSERAPKTAAPKPTAPLSSGSKYFYDMDRKRWVSVKGGKPCQGNKAAVTTMNKKLSGKSREKGPERYILLFDD